jgi:DNA repair protein RecO (recombination protein O)
MSILRLSLEPAYVLHLRPYRDSSALVECFTREHGRVGLVARGVRGTRAPLRATLQPFQHLLLSAVGRGELLTLTSAELAGTTCMLGGRSLFAGYYVNELLYRLLARNDAHAGLFDDYERVLEGIRAPAQAAPALRRFERRLLDALGYGLTLDRDVHGAPIDPAQRYHYEPERGPVSLAGADAGQGYDGALLLALARDALDEPIQLRSAQRLLRDCLDHHLDGRTLMTREWFGGGH